MSENKHSGRLKAPGDVIGPIGTAKVANILIYIGPESDVFAV